jgi:hypothetical protein
MFGAANTIATCLVLRTPTLLSKLVLLPWWAFVFLSSAAFSAASTMFGAANTIATCLVLRIP